MSIRVLVCHDDPIMRAGLGALLGREDDIEVVGEAPGDEAAMEAARRSRADVALLNTSRPTLHLMREVDLGTVRPVKVILLIAPHDDDVLEALSAGFRGVLYTGGSPSELLHAIRLVATGDAFVAPATICSHFGDLGQAERESAAREESDALTAREREVLQLLARGGSNTQIAGELSLSSATVQSHVHHLLTKLGLQNRTQAAAYAYENGYIPSASRTALGFARV